MTTPEIYRLRIAILEDQLAMLPTPAFGDETCAYRRRLKKRIAELHKELNAYYQWSTPQ